MIFIRIDRDSPLSLTRQIYEQLQLKIISGELPVHYRLPASRTLAENLHVSRNLVTEVYETLKVEGYIEAVSGSGTFVSPNAVMRSYRSRGTESTAEGPKEKPRSGHEIRFDTGIPDALFPRSHWGKCLREASVYCRPDTLDYGNDEGIPELRESLRQWLAIHKSIRCRSDQVFIFAGIHQALDLLKGFFKERNGEMAAEDPNLPSIRAKTFPTFPTGGKGPLIKDLENPGKLKAVLLTPSHSYPLARIMPIQTRVEILEHARQNGLRIVENDYDGELIYKGPTLSSMHLLAPDNVIHLGSLNGTMYPGLRLAYMVVPEELSADIGKCKTRYGYVGPSIPQLAMARFIDGGYYDDHLIRLKKHYSKQYRLLARLLTESFRDVEILGIGAGQYLTARFPGLDFIGELTKRIEEAGLLLNYAYNCTNNPSEYADTIIFQLGKLDRHHLERGVNLLTGVLRKNGP